MKCSKCGYPRVSYVKSRRNRWKGRFGDSGRIEKAYEERTDFETNQCPKCGHKEKYRKVKKDTLQTKEA